LAVESSGAVPLEQIVRQGVRNAPDVSALASLEGKKLSVLMWHYHDDDVAGASAEVELTLRGLPGDTGDLNVRHFRIDEEHGNAFAAWKRTGSPQQPTAEQYAQLERAGRLAEVAAPKVERVPDGTAAVRMTLPRRAVSLLELTW
jgi:xylan 1,4-beta-xylosidase